MNKNIINQINKINKEKEKAIAAAEAKATKERAAIVNPLLKDLRDLLETLKEVAPKELEETLKDYGYVANTPVDTTVTTVTTNTTTVPSSEVMQEAFDKVKKTRRSKKQGGASAAEKAQKRAEKKAQDEAEALDITVPEKYKEVMKVMYRSKKVCRGLYKGIPFSAGVNVGGVMVFNPMRYDLEAEIEKVLLDCNFIDPKDLTKDPYKVRESYGSVQKLRSGDYCGYVVGSNGFISLFVKNLNKERPCIMGLPSFMEGVTKPHASHDSLVTATVEQLIAAHTANNPNAVIPDPDEIATTATPALEPYSVGRDDSPDLDMDFGEEDFATAEDFEYDY